MVSATTFLLVNLLLFSLIFPFQLHAQTDTPLLNQLACFDVTQGDELLVLTPEPGGAAAFPGREFSLPVKLVNNFPYDIRGVNVVASVYQSGVVAPRDWFVVAENVHISAGRDKEIAVSWQVPADFVPDTYTVMFHLEMGRDSNPLLSIFNRYGVVASQTIVVEGVADVPAAYFDTDSFAIDGIPVEPHTIVSFTSSSTEAIFTVDMVNPSQSEVARGPLSFSLFGSFVPYVLNELESEITEARFFADSRYTKTIEIPLSSNQYILAGQMETNTGNRSSFVVPLQQTAVTPTDAYQPPKIEHVGVRTDESGGATVVACIAHQESIFANEAETSPLYSLEYRISVHPFDELGRPVRTESIISSTGTLRLSGLILDAGVQTPVATLPEEFLVRVELLQSDSLVGVSEVSYQCHEDFPCTLSSGQPFVMPKTITEIAMTSFVQALQLTTIALLIFVMAVFFVNSYTMVARSPRKFIEDNKH